MTAGLVFLLDVDNTLLDNDRVIRDLDARLKTVLGAAGAARYWAIFRALRDASGYTDYLGAAQRYRDETAGKAVARRLPWISDFLIEYPFSERLYPEALEVVAHLSGFGRTVVLTDGDAVYQPHKVRRAGIAAAVDDRVLIFIHKEQSLAAIEAWYPAARYIVVDDKPRLLAAIKQAWGERVMTILPRQGQYALDPEAVRAYPRADRTIEHIAELRALDPAVWREFAGSGRIRR